MTVVAQHVRGGEHAAVPTAGAGRQWRCGVGMVEAAVATVMVGLMLVAAMAGKLRPAIVINKSDLSAEAEDAAGTLAALDHYRKLGIPALLTSTVTGEGLEELRRLLAGHVTVLAGHSGVGKSSLLTAIDPGLELKVGDVSETHQKGRHPTSTSVPTMMRTMLYIKRFP